MIDSCYDKTSKDYNDYGRKGVTAYEEWLSNPEAFEEWCNKTYDTTLAKQIGDANVCLILNYLGDGVKEKVFSLKLVVGQARVDGKVEIWHN